jgi:hypothetical protein
MLVAIVEMESAGASRLQSVAGSDGGIARERFHHK